LLLVREKGKVERMKLTRNAMSTALTAFMVIIMSSVAVALPASAQTISAELLEAWPKWRRLDLSEHPYQVFYAKVRNSGTEPVCVKVTFVITSLTLVIHIVSTDEVWLPTDSKQKLELTWAPPGPSKYFIRAILYYKTDGIDWLEDGAKDFQFTAVS